MALHKLRVVEVRTVIGGHRGRLQQRTRTEGKGQVRDIKTCGDVGLQNKKTGLWGKQDGDSRNQEKMNV